MPWRTVRVVSVCIDCGGTVVILVSPSVADMTHVEEWRCPWCATTHHGGFPGFIRIVKRGPTDRSERRRRAETPLVR